MAIFTRRTDLNRQDRMIQCLLATPADERRFMLMSAFQTGELRLSEADQVLRTVRRLEDSVGSSGYGLGLQSLQAPAEPVVAEAPAVEPATEPVREAVSHEVAAPDAAAPESTEAGADQAAQLAAPERREADLPEQLEFAYIEPDDAGPAAEDDSRQAPVEDSARFAA